MAKSILISLLVVSVFLVAYRPVFAQEEISPSVGVGGEGGGESSDDDHVFTPKEAFEEADSPSTTGYDEEILSHLSARQKELILNNCAESMIGKCTEEVFKHLVIDTAVSKDCCGELLEIGQECHLGVSRLVFASNDLKQFASEAIPKSKQLWNKCARDVVDGIAAPVSSPFDLY